jgi:NAD(P)-dependent dehydrogenase (short-subunit alcohol dehydrogenase family)
MSKRTNRVFNGTTAVITGGASGIGRAFAEALAILNCYVVIADLQIKLAREVASRIRSAGGKAKAFKVDVCDFIAVKRLIQDTVERTGRLDFIFNNAGINIVGGVNLHEIRDWDRIIDVNLRGVVNGVHAAYNIMRVQGFGHIVNTASMSGLLPLPGKTSYTMTKHAIVGLSKSLRTEVASTNISVSVLCPGLIRTSFIGGSSKYCRNLTKVSPEKLRERHEKFKPMNPELFVKKALCAIAKNKAIIIIPSWWKCLWWLDRLSPSLCMFVAQKLVL